MHPTLFEGISKKRGKFFPAINVLGKNNTFNAHHTFSVDDKQSNFSFLVDSGSDISALPAGWIKPTTKTHKTICGPTSNSNVSCIGYASLTLDLGFSVKFPWNFSVCSSLRQPIIGADFLSHYSLYVDTANKRLLRALKHRQDSRQSPPSTSNDLTMSNMMEEAIDMEDEPQQNLASTVVPRGDKVSTNCFDVLLSSFPELTTPFQPNTTPKHSVRHHIHTNGPPVYSNPRRLSPEMLDVVKTEFDKLLKQGIVSRSNSNWASPLHLGKKSDGSYRPCGDYRKLNSITTRPTFSIPHLFDFVNNLNGAKIFSKIDLSKAYYHVPVSPDSKEKTTITTPIGNFSFNMMPFGLCGAPASFMRLMTEVVDGLKNIYVYLDDVIVFSSSAEDHDIHLRALFERLSEFGLKINKEKCSLGMEELDFLGHHISKDGFQPIEDKLEAIRKYPLPKTVKELRRFLGLFNFYRKFVPHVAETLIPLNKMLCKVKSAKQVLTWSKEALDAFNKCKDSLTVSSQLAYPIKHGKLHLVCDASDKAVGSVLNQYDPNLKSWKPLAFFSKALSPCQRRYSTYDRELLALFLSVRHFADLLLGRDVTLVTDHKPLTFAMEKISKTMSPRQIRQLNYISQYCKNIKHIPGIHNQVADSLSRLEINFIQDPNLSIDFKQFALDQVSDPAIEELKSSPSALKLEERLLENTDCSMVGDVSTGRFRPLVPRTFYDTIFHKFHSLSHGGAKATTKLIGERYVFSGMRAYVKGKCRSCLACQKSKITRHNKTPLKSFQDPPGRFQAWHIDLSGPLPNDGGCQYLFSCVDRYTRWIEAVGVPDATAATCARAFMFNVIARFGVPSQVVCDNGPAFSAQLFKYFCSNLGIKLTHSTPYHPICNSMVERSFRTLKASLRAQENPNNWTDNLPLVLLGLRSTVKEDLDVSSAQMVFGTSLHLPGQFLDHTSLLSQPTSQYVQQLINCMSHLQVTPPKHHDSPPVYVDRNLTTCSHVFVRVDAKKSALSPRYSGPHKVLHRHDKYFTLALDGKIPKVSIDRLKVAYLPNEESNPGSTPFLATQRNKLHANHSVSADNEREITATGNNTLVDDLNEFPESEIDIVCHYNDLIQRPTTTRFGRIIRQPKRFLD